MIWSEDKRTYRWGFVLDVRFQGYPSEDVCDAADKRSELNISTRDALTERAGS